MPRSAGTFYRSGAVGFANVFQFYRRLKHLSSKFPPAVRSIYNSFSKPRPHSFALNSLYAPVREQAYRIFDSLQS